MPDAPPTPDHLPPAPKLVLLVDDEPGVRRYARRVLEMVGYEVVAAAGGGEAVALARAAGRGVALLLTDVRMPDLTGRQVAERVRASLPAVPVVYMSGLPTDALPGHGIDRRAVLLLPKPFTPGELTRTVRVVLGRGG